MRLTCAVVLAMICSADCGEISRHLYDMFDGDDIVRTWSYRTSMPDYDARHPERNYDRGAASTEQNSRLLRIARHATGEAYAREFYGDGWSMQIRRAMYERSIDFFEPVNQTCREALMDFRNIPCLPPGAARTRYRLWRSRYGVPHLSRNMSPVLSGRMYYNTHHAAQELVSEYGRSIGHAVTIPAASMESCMRLDAATNSYALYPVGIALHRADDVCEEFRHYNNFSFPLLDDYCDGFRTPGVRSVTSWGEFVAAYAGLKVDAWERGYDFGVPGQAAAYVSSIVQGDSGLADISTRVPTNSMRLLAAYIEAAGARWTDSDSDGYIKIRTWFESDSVGRKVL